MSRPRPPALPPALPPVYTRTYEGSASWAFTEQKTFKSGNSEAVRIPKELAFGIGRELNIERLGDRLMLSPKTDAAAERRKVRDLLDALAAIGRPEDGVQPRPDFEAPERPGL